jgi:hypothetical protein
MTLSTHPVSRRSLSTLMSLVLLSTLSSPPVGAQVPSGPQYQPYADPCADTSPSLCAQIILKPTVQVKNLHPSGPGVTVWCATKYSEPNGWATAAIDLSVVNRDASFSPGTLVHRMSILKTALVANQPLMVTCELMMQRATPNGTLERRMVVASASTPLVPTDTNWNVVGAGSTIKWTQTVTFPNATP